MPYFAIGSAIYLAVIFSFIYRINDQKLIGCVSNIISRFTFLQLCLSSQVSPLRICPVTQNRTLLSRTVGFTTGAILTVQLVSITLTIFLTNTRSFIHLVGPPKSPSERLSYSYSELIHHTGFGILSVCSTRVTLFYYYVSL